MRLIKKQAVEIASIQNLLELSFETEQLELPQVDAEFSFQQHHFEAYPHKKTDKAFHFRS